jgi:ATP-dependent DNA helicase PIF1
MSQQLSHRLSVQLSLDQAYAFEKFKCGENLFITGPGGTGKTHLIEKFVDHAKSHSLNIQVCAMTGCASVLLKCGARTLHSWAGIKLAKGPINQIIRDILRSKQLCANWRAVKVLIVDEVSMMSRKIFELIEELARAVRKNTAAFGGIQTIFTGDFFQLPPVGTPGDPTTEMFCFESPRWAAIFPPSQCIELKTIFRQTDPLYKEILLQVRTASLTPKNTEILKSHVGREFDPAKYNGCYPTKLFPTRAKTDFLNKTMFEKLAGQEYTFTVIRKTDCKTFLESCKVITPQELAICDGLSTQDIEHELQQLKTTASYEDVLTLKVGAVVMCSVNLDMDRGICNGAQGTIVDMTKIKDKVTASTMTVPVVRFANGTVMSIPYHYRQSEDFPTIAVAQIPLCLAWALTIHKIQGATLTMAEIDVGMQIFECGQTYVALSRVQSLDGLYLKAFNPQRIRVNESARIFYQSIPAIDYEKALSELSLHQQKVVEPNFEKFRYVEPEQMSPSTVKVIKL